MRIFYFLSILVLFALPVKSQVRQASLSEPDPASKTVKFYPNPATSIITFDFLKDYDKSSYTLYIFNLIGKKLYEANNVSSKTVVNLNDFYRGIYIFQLRDKNGQLIDFGKFQVAK